MGWQEEELARREANSKKQKLYHEQVRIQNAEIQKIWDQLIEKNGKLHGSLQARVYHDSLNTLNHSEYSDMRGSRSNEHARLEKWSPYHPYHITLGTVEIGEGHFDLQIRFDPEKGRCVFVAELSRGDSPHGKREYQLDDGALDQIIQNLATGEKLCKNIPVIWMSRPIQPLQKRRKGFFESFFTGLEE